MFRAPLRALVNHRASSALTSQSLFVRCASSSSSTQLTSSTSHASFLDVASSSSESHPPDHGYYENVTDIESTEARRAYTYLMTGATYTGTAILVKNSVMTLLYTLSPTERDLSLGETEVDLSKIKEGETITVLWRKKPVFIRKRTQVQIDKAAEDDFEPLRDPQPDCQRTSNPEYLITLGICTHLGCVPISNAGEWGGWFCPCHGSHYDLSGRIRKGPAPKNLEVPPYKFDPANNKVIIGQED